MLLPIVAIDTNICLLSEKKTAYNHGLFIVSKRKKYYPEHRKLLTVIKWTGPIVTITVDWLIICYFMIIANKNYLKLFNLVPLSLLLMIIFIYEKIYPSYFTGIIDDFR